MQATHVARHVKTNATRKESAAAKKFANKNVTAAATVSAIPIASAWIAAAIAVRSELSLWC